MKTIPNHWTDQMAVQAAWVEKLDDFRPHQRKAAKQRTNRHERRATRQALKMEVAA